LRIYKDGKIIERGDSISYGEIWRDYVNYTYPAAGNAHFIYIEDTLYYLFHPYRSYHKEYSKYGIVYNKILYSKIAFINNTWKCVEKDIVLDSIYTSFGYNSFVRHGNGKDWWLVNFIRGTNEYRFYLLKEGNITLHHKQNIGDTYLNYLDDFNTEVLFNPSGTMYVRNEWNKGAELMQFDRCKGLFTNVKRIIRTETWAGSYGIAFSPNERFLYITNNDYLVQMDLDSDDIASTIDTVMVWDRYFNPFYMGFAFMCLAPDEKIYISPFNGNQSFHVINRPNLKGKACDTKMHVYPLSSNIFGGIGRYINYRLGVLKGSPCEGG
jgi:hypothetical protein